MKILNLLLKPDEMAIQVVDIQGAECVLETVDLRQADVNYDELLKKVFAADSVQVW